MISQVLVKITPIFTNIGYNVKQGSDVASYYSDGNTVTDLVLFGAPINSEILRFGG